MKLLKPCKVVTTTQAEIMAKKVPNEYRNSWGKPQFEL